MGFGLYCRIVGSMVGVGVWGVGLGSCKWRLVMARHFEKIHKIRRIDEPSYSVQPSLLILIYLLWRIVFLES